jgi:hypothetical protein
VNGTEVAFIGVPLVLLLLAAFGDLIPGVILFGALAVEIFVLRGLVHSHSLAYLVPFGLAVAYKMLRGDERGTNGRRLP